MIHTHVHTDGSVLDGAAGIQRLVARAVELGMPALGISDHGNMIKAVEFQLECQKAGIKPIIGCEFYEIYGDKTVHVLLIAKDQDGLKNLFRLNTLSYKPDRFYRKPRIKWEDIVTHGYGLIMTTACIGSAFGEAFFDNDHDEIRALICDARDYFGSDFYIEIQPNAIPSQADYNRLMIQMAHQEDISVIATTDVHYVLKEDYQAHDTMLCMQTGKKKEDTDRFRFTCNDFYLKSGAEMYHQLIDMGTDPIAALVAIENTTVLSDKCNALIQFNQQLLPHVPGIVNEDLTLAQHCNVGFQKRYAEGHFNDFNINDVVERIKYELQVIRQKGYSGYFLIVEDFINYAHSQDIPVGGGRGSVCGSEVAFILGITQVEPIRYGLLFERFLNPDRNSPPDIDSDFDYEFRGRMLEYVKEKYGHDNVAQIVAEGTLACNAVVRKVLSAYNYEPKEVNRIMKLVPKDLGITIEKALDMSPEFAMCMARKQNELHDMRVLEGLMSHVSKHAAGVVITPVPVADVAPCMSDSEDRNSMVVQWDKKMAEKVGLFKFDFLGLKRLTIVRWTLENIFRNKGIRITHDDLFKIDLEDPIIYEVLNSGDLAGIFQFDAPAGKQTVKDAKPNCFEDIVVCESICRPGVKEAQLYLDNKRDVNNPDFDTDLIHWSNDIIKEILAPTYGAIVYQEQTMLLMNKLAGWTLGKADSMRKVKNLEDYRDEFVRDCVARGYSSDLANSVFNRFSLEYSFNKSHAAAYGINSAQDCYLKGNFRVEFMAAMMSMDILKGGENMREYIQECLKYDIRILPPDVNKSGMTFICDGNTILYPLTGISGIGEAAVEKILETRPYASLEDFLSKVPKKSVNKKAVQQLIKAGVFDLLTHELYLGNRAALLNNYLTMIGDAPNQLTWCNELQMQYEMDSFGMTLTKHPLDGHVIADFNSLEDGAGRYTAGIVGEVRTTNDKNGKQMAFATIHNKTATIELIVFARTYERVRQLLQPNMKISVTGTKEGNKLLVNTMEVL